MVTDSCIRHTLKSNRERVDASNSGGSSFNSAFSIISASSRYAARGATSRSRNPYEHDSTQISFDLTYDSFLPHDTHNDILDTVNALVDRLNAVEYRLSELENVQRIKPADEESPVGKILSILYRLLKLIRASAFYSQTSMIPNGTTDN